MPVDLNLIGDARLVLELILEASAGRSPDAEVLRGRGDALQVRLSADSVATDPSANQDTTPVLPQRLARLLSEHLSGASNICLDGWSANTREIGSSRRPSAPLTLVPSQADSELRGYTVTHSKDLPDILEAAQASGKTAVIDVVMDDKPSPDDFRARPRAITET